MNESRLDNLPKATLVEALRRSGSRTISMERLEADVAAGAPVNADGMMSAIKYTAWILKEMADDD